MKNNGKVILICLAILVFPKLSFATIAKHNKFIVILFEWSGQKFNEKLVHYWILPVYDEIEEFKIYPLVFSDFSSVDSYKRCARGEQIDLFTSTSETRFDFDEQYLLHESSLKSLIKRNKKLIHQIIMRRPSGIFKKEKINVYITPLFGDFFSCVQFHDSRDVETNRVIGEVYFPGLNAELNLNFWDSKYFELLVNYDFFEFDFESYLPPYKRLRMSQVIKKSVDRP
jgi:hypothetical protein